MRVLLLLLSCGCAIPTRRFSFARLPSPAQASRSYGGYEDAASSYARRLQSCSSIGEGRLLHARITEDGLASDVYVANHLLLMYGRCGSLHEAQRVFNSLERRNVFTWTLLISNYAEQGCFTQAAAVYRRMLLEGERPNKVTFINMLKACTDARVGEQVHHAARETGVDSDVVLGSALVTMYGKLGTLPDAELAFERIREKNVVSWTALIAASAEQGASRLALDCFRRMQLEGEVLPNCFTYSAVLGACGELACIRDTRSIYSQVQELQFESDVVVGTALIEAFGKCYSVADARAVFDRMQARDTVCWSCMIAAYAGGEEAVQVFRAMLQEGGKPDRVTFIAMLEVGSRASRTAEFVSFCAAEAGFGSDRVVGSALINMFAKLGSVAECCRAFERIAEVADPVSWSTLVAVHVQNGLHREGIQIYRRTLLEGVAVEQETFIAMLSSSTALVDYQLGKQVHETVLEKIRSEYHNRRRNCCVAKLDVAILTGLVAMYGKCGWTSTAYRLFFEDAELQRFEQKDVVCWNAMLGVYSEHGMAEECLEVFRRMQQDYVKAPDETSFIRLLSCCSRAGLVEEAWLQLVAMVDDYGVSPELEHYVCVIDLLGRAGELDAATELIGRMPCRPNSVLWSALLAAYGLHERTEDAVSLGQQLLRSNLRRPCTYVIISNICKLYA